MILPYLMECANILSLLRDVAKQSIEEVSHLFPDKF